jgi:hypothetical protein
LQKASPILSSAIKKPKHAGPAIAYYRFSLITLQGCRHSWRSAAKSCQAATPGMAWHSLSLHYRPRKTNRWQRPACPCGPARCRREHGARGSICIASSNKISS